MPTDGTPGTARNGSEAPVGGASTKDPIKRKMRFLRTPTNKKEVTSDRPRPDWNDEWNYSFDNEIGFVDDLYKKDGDHSQSSKQGSKSKCPFSTDVKEPQTKSYLDDWDMMLSTSDMATGPNTAELLSKVKAFFLSAGYPTPRSTIGTKDEHLKVYKDAPEVYYFKTPTDEVAL